MKIYLRLVCLLLLLMGVSAFAQSQRQPRVVSQSSVDLLDLNTATVEQLKALPGMGEVYARRVVAGRPYSAKNQLVTRGILPQSAYQKMQPLVVARRLKNK